MNWMNGEQQGQLYGHSEETLSPTSTLYLTEGQVSQYASGNSASVRL